MNLRVRGMIAPLNLKKSFTFYVNFSILSIFQLTYLIMSLEIHYFTLHLSAATRIDILNPSLVGVLVTTPSKKS